MMRCLCGLFLVLALHGPARADDTLTLVLEPSRVDISADFSGAGVKAIGSMTGPGELIVKVLGPPQDVRLSRKTQLGPFWVGGDSIKLGGAPSLLFLRATAPIAMLLPPAERERQGLLLDSLPLRLEPQLSPEAASTWRKAYLELQRKNGYYQEGGEAIKISESGQFIVDIGLPGDLQTGSYRVEALRVSSGKVLGRTTGEFKVRLVGMEQWIWNAAHAAPWLFGSLLTLAAMLLGTVLSAIPYRLR